MASEWQPIKTAPKDAPLLLAYLYPNKEALEHIRKHHDAKAEQVMLIQVGCWHAQGKYWMYSGARLHEPIYWMPLPELPATEISDNIGAELKRLNDIEECVFCTPIPSFMVRESLRASHYRNAVFLANKLHALLVRVEMALTKLHHRSIDMGDEYHIPFDDYYPNIEETLTAIRDAGIGG